MFRVVFSGFRVSFFRILGLGFCFQDFGFRVLFSGFRAKSAHARLVPGFQVFTWHWTYVMSRAQYGVRIHCCELSVRSEGSRITLLGGSEGLNKLLFGL